jgi:hypothetical protein
MSIPITVPYAIFWRRSTRTTMHIAQVFSYCFHLWSLVHILWAKAHISEPITDGIERSIGPVPRRLYFPALQ